MKNRKLYALWQRTKGKCFNSNDQLYHLFGGRGISVCEDWDLHFPRFQKWCFENGYQEGMYFIRINSDGNFEPSNCKWVSQRPPTRKSKMHESVTFKGETHTYLEWAKILNVPWQRITWRLAHNWDTERIITTATTKPGRTRLITFNGETHSLSEWAQITGKSVSCLSARINYNGWSVADALTKPPFNNGRKKRSVVI